MPMKADLWFPTVIWNDHLKDVNNSDLKEYVEKLAQEDKEGKVASNYGGWQSKSFEILFGLKKGTSAPKLSQIFLYFFESVETITLSMNLHCSAKKIE